MLSAQREVQMPFTCELWTSEPDKKVGDYEFDCVPRSGEAVSLPKDDEDAFVHYRVVDVTHRANGPRHPAATYVFVSRVK
jgi:hypothetical protein